MTDFNTWLNVQRGVSQSPDVFDATPRYMRNGRDIGQWVHVDVLFQAITSGWLHDGRKRAPADGFSRRN